MRKQAFIKIFVLILSSFLIFSSYIYAESSLFFGEVQSIAGYSSMDNKMIYRSGHEKDTMQKNSIGFDLIKKFSSKTRDILTAALQLRVAYDDSEEKAQLQIYNAYLKVKTSIGDISLGHNRVAFGLESYWDTHGELIQPLQMYGFGYDRDWGIVFSKDTDNGNVQFALTSGTAMALRFKNNWLATSRISKGVLSYDNYTLGLSVMAGNILETMGYTIMSEETSEIGLAATDFAYNHNNFEHKAQVNVGKITDDMACAGLYRLSLNFLEENKLKLEWQYVYTRRADFDNHYIDAAINYKINSDITTRLAYSWQREMNDNKIAAQFYYYFLI
ncbi:MAG: hypothetical protein LBD46_06035 [Endomicrobium sp.]|jgi:hypothetical protein|nr:hypothetical protein [Endomicrobium sp.]